MNVSEVEALLGMTRANIRYYEREGLLEPARSENGYRDYSQEDVRALEKIKLLRQLHLDLESIRKIQRGETALPDAVREQMERLRGQRADLEWAEQVCRELSSARVGYAELNARPYLERLGRPEGESGGLSLREDELETVPHPWRRFFARWLDLGFYELLWTAFHILVLRWNPESNAFIDLLDAYISFLLMIGLEPILLALWGYTPGKWLMGLEVRDRAGKRLTLAAALTRTLGVFRRGYGCGIPIYNLVRLWKCRVDCLQGEALEWEEGRYRLKNEKPWRIAAMAGAAVFQFFLLFVILAQGAMPIHRGSLTAAEYAENINAAARYNHVMEYYRMDESGHWENCSPSGVYVIDIFEERMPDHQLILTDGVVTGVRLEIETVNPDLTVLPSTAQKQLAAIALAAAQRSYHCLSWVGSGVLKAIEAGGMEDYVIHAGDMTVTNRVEYSGMESGGDILFPKEGERAYYHMVFTVEKSTG